MPPAAFEKTVYERGVDHHLGWDKITQPVVLLRLIDHYTLHGSNTTRT